MKYYDQHIHSSFSKDSEEDLENYFKEGDEIIVKVIAIDDKGKIKLSRKAVFAKEKKED